MKHPREQSLTRDSRITELEEVVVLEDEESKKKRLFESRIQFYQRMEKKFNMKIEEIINCCLLDFWILNIMDHVRWIDERDLRKIMWRCYLRALTILEENERISRNGYKLRYITDSERVADWT